ncbi:MAG: helix-turn-helix domain-containing protein [Kiritimatiellae bacterium]|jgi:AraC-like DNA-binding protein|nr:helix-turn-helix domain-containing protein [Kiritimatiellia bacterium]
METHEKINISDLMAWIENQTGAVVSFADLRGITNEIPMLRLHPDQYIHHSPYCEFAKLNGHLAQCMADKKQSYQRAENGKPFESVCPLGIWEWIQPVFFKSELLGVLFLGCLRSAAGLKPAGGRVYHGPDLPVVSDVLKKKLRQYARLLRDVILLTIEEWVRAGHRLSKQKPLQFYRDVTMLFIQNHYHDRTRLKDLARQLKVHPYYLGRIIRQVTGKDFKTLVMERRINRAKFMFRSGRRNVTEVAYACGFGDGNYFSTVFRRMTGQSPREFFTKNSGAVPCFL